MLGIHRKEINMLEGSLWDKIIVFALPIALTGILEQMFNAADVAVLGRFVGTEAMAAVGNNVPIVGLIVTLFLGLSLGANVVIAQYIGARHLKEASRAVHTALALSILAGIGVALLGELFAAPLLSLLDVPDAVMPLAELYLRVFLMGMPFMSVYNFASAILRSHGDTGTPLIALLAASALNVVLDLGFVLVLGLGADGVAWGTVLSYLVAASLLIRALRREEGVLRLDFRLLRVRRHHAKRIFVIGMPAAVQGMVFCFANLVIQAALNSLGAEVMAASAAAFTIEINMYCVIAAFQQACTTFVSQNYGAGNLPRCREVTRWSLRLNIIAMLVLGALILLFMRPLLRIFNGDPAVVEIGVIRIVYVVVPEIFAVFIDIFSGSMRGYGYSLMPAVVTLVCICGVRLSWVWLVFPHCPTFETLMVIYPISWAVTSLCIYFLYRFYLKHLKVMRLT
ncbi:MATE family efflux transporter [uncultured Selenomonas sp.]|uniref:MATE family efflux transporter n=1 Tax=uncultured Selenomonas sp. TaxID=159275 RepID=UPI0028D23C33|nr:MATE family efflux transporter [uncultured Selenomonas sp.]